MPSADLDPASIDQDVDETTPVPTSRELMSLLETAAGCEEAAATLDALPSDEIAHLVGGLSEADRDRLLGSIEASSAADVIETLPEIQAVRALDHLEPEAAAAIVHELPSDEQADIVRDLHDPEAVLAQLEPEEAASIRELSEYGDETAGGLMIREFLAFPLDHSVGDVVASMQNHADEQRDYDVQYVYVTGPQNELVGVLRLRDLLLSPRHRPIAMIMIPDPLSVEATAELPQLHAFFQKNNYLGAPVLDENNQLLGVLEAAAVEDAMAERGGSDLRRALGIVGGEELRSMPLVLRSSRRLAWLSLNIVLNIMAASIIAFNQDTLEAVIALAVFLPIISDMSGCSGNQAVAVSMRELSLNVSRPSDVLRVWGKEVMVGLVNGAVLGTLLGLGAWAWQGNPALGLVVGAALAINTVVAVSIGGCVPLLLRGLKLDPALASGPILTTVTDMCGFMLVLGMASQMLDRLA
ncbi:MAG: magnesium transporter [Phycisphaerales bacterium]